MGFIKPVSLRIENDTFTDVVLTHVPTSSLNISEWETSRNARPDLNFNNQCIPAGFFLERSQDINWMASKASFNMTLYFKDGSQDNFQLNMKHARDPDTTLLDFLYWENHHHLQAWREGTTIRVRVSNTRAQKENRLAENLKEEAELLIKQKRYEEAPNKLREALGFANEWSTRQEIKTSLARIYHHLGEKLMHEGDDLQRRGDVEETLKKYEEAKLCFEEARKVKNTEKYVNSGKMIILKIEGNQVFDEATKIEKEAFQLFEKAKNPDDFAKAQNKYKETLAKYEEALKKYEEGAKIDAAKFGFALNITKLQIQAVGEAITDIDKVASEQHVEEKPDQAEEKPKDAEEKPDNVEEEPEDTQGN